MSCFNGIILAHHEPILSSLNAIYTSSKNIIYLSVHALVSFDKTKKKREEKNEKPSDRLLRSPGTNTLMVLTFSMFMCRSIWRKELKKNLSCSILGLYKGNIMTRKEIIHRCLCLKRLIYRVNQIKLQGLVSRKTRGNFSGSKANFKIKTC